MLGVELRRNARAGSAADVARRVLKRGIIVLPGGEDGEVLQLIPPATLTSEELEGGLETLVAAIRSAR